MRRSEIFWVIKTDKGYFCQWTTSYTRRDAISKFGLSVGKHFINLNTAATNSYPERGETSGFVITLKQGDEHSPKISFDPSKVLNQAPWNTGATSLASGAQQAIADIVSWLV